MRKTIIALVVALASLVPGGAIAQQSPESKAKMTDLQGDAPSEYTVVKGDTLWGIAGKFLKEPWKWPLIWQMNRDQIKDPHWIYPGDIIKLDRSGAYPELSLVPGGAGGFGGGADVAAGNVVRLQPRIRTETLSTAIPTIPGSAIGPFLSQPVVVEVAGLEGSPSIVATEESRVVVGAGNLAYADRIGASSGVNWQVFRPGSALTDPDTGEILGYEAHYLGDARVRRFGNPTTLEITKARQEINRGDKLMPARETSYSSYVPRAPDKPIKGSIMSVDGGVSELGQYQIITINRGSRDGVEVGHVLASYHKGRTLGPEGVSTDFFGIKGLSFGTPIPVVPENPAVTAARTSGDDKGGAVLSGAPEITLPDERNGLVFVFRVFEKMSYAMVMKASRPIYVGDIVQTP